MGRFLGNTGGHSMFDRFYHHWSRQMREGLITEDEFHNTTFSQHYRTVEEFTRPFRNKNSKVNQVWPCVKFLLNDGDPLSLLARV